MASTLSNRLFGGFLFSIMFCMFTSFVKLAELMEQEQHNLAKESIGNIPFIAMNSVDSDPLEHEAIFIDTLKDCIPSNEGRDGEKNKKECKTFVPEGSKERIAVLAPPGKMTPNLLKFIRAVLMKGKKGGNGEFAAAGVEIIPETHMVRYHLQLMTG